MSDETEWVVEATDGNRRTVESRSEAEAVKKDVEQLDVDATIIPPKSVDGSQAAVQALDESTGMGSAAPEQFPDPLTYLPGWMVDRIDHGTGQSKPHLNKRGCQMIADHLGLVVQSEAVKRASETEWEYAEYRAWVQGDGSEHTKRFTATGVAHIDEGGRTPQDLDLVAETRAKKRSVKWATGGGSRPFTGENSG